MSEEVLAQAEALIWEQGARTVRNYRIWAYIAGGFLLGIAGASATIIINWHLSESDSLIFLLVVAIISVILFISMVSSLYGPQRMVERAIHVLRTATPVILPMTITEIEECGSIISTGCAAKQPGKLSHSSAEGSFGIWKSATLAQGSLFGLSKPNGFDDRDIFCAVYALRDDRYPVVILTRRRVYLCGRG
ncbi:MAG: hypothetical protein ACYDBB_13910 [Armatimonadota bacterium]